MKKIALLLTLCLAITGVTNMNAQEFNGLDKSPHDISYYRTDTNAAPIIKVLYGRPQLRGRKIGKQLAPYNELWRTGANEATEIKFYKTVTLGETIIEPGTYSLFTIPGKNEWTIIINKDTDVWGAYTYNQEHDVARIKVPTESEKESLNAFSITFENEANEPIMVLGWDKVRIYVPFKIS